MAQRPTVTQMSRKFKNHAFTIVKKQITGIKGEWMNDRKHMGFKIILTHWRNEIEVSVAIYMVNFI